MMAALKIEKNIPPPKKINRRIYPFNCMEVNDSFEIAIENNHLAAAKKQNVYQAIWKYSKANPDKKFTTASTDAGMRVWRIQ